MDTDNPIVTRYHIIHNCLYYENPLCKYLTQDKNCVDKWWQGRCTHPLIQQLSINSFQEMKGYLTMCPRKYLNEARSNLKIQSPRQGHGIMFPCKS